MSARSDVIRAERIERLVTLVTVLLPLAAVVGAAILGWRDGVPPAALVACGLMYWFTIAGISLGYHRLFTHHGYACAPAVRWLVGIAGSMAGQGPLFFWVSCHRRHHQHSDEEGDPHSPHLHDDGAWGVIRGWWHAHLGWMLVHKPENYFRLVNDLVRDPVALAVHRYYPAWVAAGLLLPAAACGLVTRSWAGFGQGLLWGGLVRMFLAHHMTWCVNSVCHLFGAAPHATGDESRNNLLVALATFGEGWHNNHHAFPSSARHGLRPWEVDPSYLGLRLLQALGLVWNLRLPEGSHSTGHRPSRP